MFSRTTQATRSAPRGFTLVELVLVLFIIGVIAAIAMPRFAQATARQQLEAAADRVMSDIELARARALAASSTVTMTFDRDEDLYSLDAVGGDAFTLKLNEPPYNTRIASLNFGGISTLTFNGYGIPSGSGQITVKHSNTQKIKILLSAEGQLSR